MTDDNYYFWLGADGEIAEVTPEEFEDNQEDCRKDLDDWINVRVK